MTSNVVAFSAMPREFLRLLEPPGRSLQDQDSIEPPGKLRELIEEVAAWLRLPGAMGSWTVSSTLHPRYRRKQGPWRRLCSRQWPSCRQMCRIAREFTRGESACTLHRVAAARELGSRRITVGWKS